MLIDRFVNVTGFRTSAVERPSGSLSLEFNADENHG